MGRLISSSNLPPLSLCPYRRALITFVSLKMMAQSFGKKDSRASKREWVMVSDERSYTNSRA